jgi:hypothetical protein
LTIGDVLLAESISPGVTNVSDIVRFWTNNMVIFYSDQETAGSGDNDLADASGLPQQYLGNPLLVFETGTEGNNGAPYHANPGQPGWDGNPAGTQYQFISDVPEPGSGLLTIVGGGLLLLLRRRRQARR